MSGVQPSSLLDFFLFLMVKGKSEALNTFSLIREMNAGATLPAVCVLFGMTGPSGSSREHGSAFAEGGVSAAAPRVGASPKPLPGLVRG